MTRSAVASLVDRAIARATFEQHAGGKHLKQKEALIAIGLTGADLEAWQDNYIDYGSPRAKEAVRARRARCMRAHTHRAEVNPVVSHAPTAQAARDEAARPRLEEQIVVV